MVEESVAEQFCQALLREIPRMFDPNGIGYANALGYPRIINTRHWERITSLIDDAVAKGATLLCGGEYNAEDRFISPTGITDVKSDMKVMQEETFGPVLVVKRWSQRDDVIREIGSRETPLALYIFAKKTRRN